MEVHEWSKEIVHWVANMEPPLHQFMHRTSSHIESMATLAKNDAVKKDELKAEVEYLAGRLYKMAFLSRVPDSRFLDCFKTLVASEVHDGRRLTWASVLRILLCLERRHLDSPQWVETLVQLFNDYAPIFSCTFSRREACRDFSDAVFDFFKWLIAAISDCETDADDQPIWKRVEYDKSTALLTSTLSRYARDRFYCAVMQSRHCMQTDVATELVVSVRDMAEHFPDYADYKQIAAEVTRFTARPEYKQADFLVNHLCKRNAIIRTAVAVFSHFRVLASVQEVAETLAMLGTTVKMENQRILSDILLASFFLLMDEEENTEKPERFLVESFVFLKLPQVLSCLLCHHGYSREEVAGALHYTLRDSRNVLDAIDEVLVEDAWVLLLQKLCELKVVTEETAEELERRRQAVKRPPLMPRRDPPHKLLIFVAQNARHSLRDWKGHDDMMTYLFRLRGNGQTLDAFCATYCVEGDLSVLSSKLATVCAQMEDPSVGLTGDERWGAFDLTFSMLVRIALHYERLSLREMVNGLADRHNNTRGAFYRWARRFIRPEEESEGEAMEGIDDERRAEAAIHLKTLVEGRHFWDSNSADLGEILEWVPLLGDLLLEDNRPKHTHSEYDVAALVSTLLSASSVLLCLVQWLELRPPSEGRQSLSRHLKASLDNGPVSSLKEEMDRYQFCRGICLRSLEEMAEGPRVPDPVTLVPFSIVNRPLPTLHRHERPDKEVLKKALVFCARQHWACPRVLTLIERLNHAGRHMLWVESFIHNLSKSTTNEDMITGMELVFGVALLDPLPSFRALCQRIGDSVLPEKSKNEESDKSCSAAEKAASDVTLAVCPPIGAFNARFLVLSMIVSLWAVKVGEATAAHLQGDRPPPSPGQGEEEEVSSDDLPGTVRAHMAELRDTVGIIFNRIYRKSSLGMLNSVTAFICIVMHEMATAPRTPAWKSLVSIMPPDLLLILGRIDPQMMTYELMWAFSDEGDNADGDDKLRFVCMARKSGGL